MTRTAVLIELLSQALAGAHALTHPEAPDATDETRLAAGWWQEADGGQGVGVSPDGASLHSEPAPGPAGRWRLHSAGCWVRWVRAVAP